jgi:phosphohistidine phosphatase
MRSEALLPSLVLASSAIRVGETLKLWQKSSGYTGPIRIHDQLYLAEPKGYVELLNGLTPEFDPVLCVGHNPGLEELVRMLTGKSERMATAALAKIHLPIDDWRQISLQPTGELVNVWRVNELGD